jgi:hypothetical protein
MTASIPFKVDETDQDATSSSLTVTDEPTTGHETGVEKDIAEKRSASVENPELSGSDSIHSSSSSSLENGEVRLAPSQRTLSRTVSNVYHDIQSLHDVEIGAEIEKDPPDARDPNLVCWAANDPDNPKTWTFKKKWAAVLVGMSSVRLRPLTMDPAR